MPHEAPALTMGLLGMFGGARINPHKGGHVPVSTTAPFPPHPFQPVELCIHPTTVEPIGRERAPDEGPGPPENNPASSIMTFISLSTIATVLR